MKRTWLFPMLAAVAWLAPAARAQDYRLSEKVQSRLEAFVFTGTYGDDTRYLPSGWRIRSPETSGRNPEAFPDPSDTNPAVEPGAVGSIGGALDMEDARLLYKVSGGLAALDEELRIFGDGRATVVWDRGARGDDSGELSAQLSQEQMAMLKELFSALDFRSLPGEFEADGNVADGIDMLVAVRFGSGELKSVMSHTGADEDPRFTAIRFVLDKLTDQLRRADLIELIHRVPGEPDLTRRVTLGPPGILEAVSVRSEFPPLIAMLSVEELAQIHAAFRAIDFPSLPEFVGSPPPRSPVIEMRINFGGLIRSFTFAPEDDDPRVQPLNKLADLIEAARKARS